MANIIKPKRSSVTGKVPTTSDIVSGEIAINNTDQKIYTNNGSSVVQIGAGKLSALGEVSITSPTTDQVLKYNGTNWVNASGGGGGVGDVNGPASSTDNAITRFDGTTGKLIQNSTVTINDDGTFDNVNAITLDTTPTSPPATAGSIYWDTGNGTPTVVLNANTSLQLGQENIALVYNGTGSTITNGSVVAVSGAQGQRPSVVLADADSEPYSAATLGIATENIANGAEGYVCTFGLVRGLDTSAFTAGQPIWLSQTAGQFTATKPTAPAHLVFLGWVIKVNASSGELFVNISNGWELDELHNVLITSPTSGNTLIYDASVGVWKNANLTDGTGINITEGAGSITIANSGVTSAIAGTGISVSSATGAVTITNSAPDQVVSLTSGTGISATGTYPNFTITNTAPDQTVSLTNGGGIGISGTYPNFTLTNNGVTSVSTGTGLTGGPITSTGTISLANTAVTPGAYTNANITVDAQGRITLASNGTSGGTPGGSTTQIQYNNAGAFAGASGLTTDGTNLTLNAQADLRFADADSSNWVAFQAPSTIASNVTWTLPAADGSNGQFLSTDGSGILSWATASGGGGGGAGIYTTTTQITATSGQTTFTVSYTVGQVSVYLNGALLASSDYTASDGTTIVLATGATAGDIFTAVAYFSPAVTQLIKGDTSVTVTDTGSNGTISMVADNVQVASITSSNFDIKKTLKLSGTTSGYVGIQPAAIAGSTTYTLPSADGTNGQALTTNGTGTLAWSTVVSPPGGSTTQLQYNNAGSFAGASGLVTDGSNLTINAQGDIRLADADSSNWVALHSPTTLSQNITFTLPTSYGTNGQFLQTDGVGSMVWATPSPSTVTSGGGVSTTTLQTTATGGQTTFSFTYTVGQLSVYLNGTLLSTADYTASDGSTIVLTTGATAGDILTAIGYTTVSTVSQGNSNVTVSDTGSNGTITFTTEGSERMRVNSSGNLLVGTSSSYANYGIPLLQLDNSSGAEFSMRRSVTTDGSTVGFITGYSTHGLIGVMSLITDGAQTASSTPGALRFMTQASGSTGSPSERMRISAAGNVGIGGNPETFGIANYRNLVIGNSGVAAAGITFSTNGSAGTVPGLAFARDGGGVNGYLRYDQAIGAMTFGTEASERMRISSAGNVLIGTTTANNATFAVNAVPNNVLGQQSIWIAGARTTYAGFDGLFQNQLCIYDSTASTAGSGGAISFAANTGSTQQTWLAAIASSRDSSTNDNYGGSLRFLTRPDQNVPRECGRFTSQQFFKASNSGSYPDGSNVSNHYFNSSIADQSCLFVRSDNTSIAGMDVLFIRGNRNTTNNTFRLIAANNGNDTGVFNVRDSGNCVNTNNSYGSLSDVKLKQDIVDAGSQWNDIKNLKIRKYRFKNNPDGPLQIGLIAQETELVSPGLVESENDVEEIKVPVLNKDGNEVIGEDGNPQFTTQRKILDTTTKSIKYSVLYMKAVKALQEAMEKIENLENQNAAFEQRIALLEAKGN